MIYRWTTIEKRLPHFRLGGSGRRGKIVIEDTDLDAFMRTLKVEGASVPPPKVTSPKFKHLRL